MPAQVHVRRRPWSLVWDACKDGGKVYLGTMSAHGSLSASRSNNIGPSPGSGVSSSRPFLKTAASAIWNDPNVWIDNVDWSRRADGSPELEWALPHGVAFGATVSAQSEARVEMQLWLRNGLAETLTGLHTQICMMLKGAPDFNSQETNNKVFSQPVAAIRSVAGNRWILTAWQRAGRVWGNKNYPCIHSDPVLADYPPGQTVRVQGWLWFHEGVSIDEAIVDARREFG